ncbi:MAG: alginate export family protein [Bdellovibrionia bacterium]
MSKLWTILFGLALVSTAHAQSTDFKWNAELRTRYTNDMNRQWLKGSLGENSAMFEGRTKLGVTMMKGDSLTGHVSLLHNNIWGNKGDSTATAGYSQHPAAVAGNSLSVQEAWGWWKSNDMLSMKFGRAGFEYGDGTIFALNDWNNLPNSWEGIWTQWGFDFADMHLFGNKLLDSETSVAGNSDPEIVAYGLVVNFKNLPEFLKHAFLHVVNVNADQVTALPAGAVGANQMHYGLTLMGDANSLDYRFTADIFSGKYKGVGSDMNLKGTMFDAELGWSMPEFMKARFGFMIHMDTGDDSTTPDSEGYSPLYYDQHKYAGLMDVVSWGNSTYYGVSFGMNPSEDLNAGLSVLMFSRTSDKAAANITPGPGATATDAKPVGNEIDLHATKTYGDNFSIFGLYGMFMPGEYVKKSLGDQGDTFSKLQLQAKLTF